MKRSLLGVLFLLGCQSLMPAGPTHVAPAPAPLTTKLPRLKSTPGLYTDTGAGEEVKAYYAGDPQWGPITSEMSTEKDEVKMVTGYVWVDGARIRVWNRTSTNVVLVSLRKYESECLMRRFVLSQDVYKDPAAVPEAWESASSYFLISKESADENDAVRISCADFDKMPNDPIIAEREAAPVQLLGE